MTPAVRLPIIPPRHGIGGRGNLWGKVRGLTLADGPKNPNIPMDRPAVPMGYSRRARRRSVVGYATRLDLGTRLFIMQMPLNHVSRCVLLVVVSMSALPSIGCRSTRSGISQLPGMAWVAPSDAEAFGGWSEDDEPSLPTPAAGATPQLATQSGTSTLAETADSARPAPRTGTVAGSPNAGSPANDIPIRVIPCCISRRRPPSRRRRP